MNRVFSAALLLALLAACAPKPEPAPAEYVDSAKCATCHAAIAETYKKTGMGRSFSRPTATEATGTLHHEASDRYYTMTSRDGRFFQRRHQIGPDGQATNVIEVEANYVVGSGNHVRTYLHLNEQKKLVELPVAWYAEDGGHWGMNPGYDWMHHSDFRRRLNNECVFCHNAYPSSARASDRADMEATFPAGVPEGVDCQRCHGPGGKHVQVAGDATSSIDAIRNAIVNPKRLAPERQLEVCMQCHLESTSAPLPFAIRNFGRGVFSYKPGEPLADYITHFDHAPGTGRDDKFEIAGAAYRLRKSQCFIQSAGAMTCTTCHDPHNIPRGADAVAHYVAVCNGCHEAKVKSESAAGKHPSSKDCLSCHMPKRRADDVIHAVMTDHYIQRRKADRDLLAPLSEKHGVDEDPYRGEVVRYYGAENDLYLAVAQVTARVNLDNGVTRLRDRIDVAKPAQGLFYFELAKAYAENGSPLQAIPVFQQTLERLPDFWPALHRLGLAFGKTNQSAAAIDYLERASRISTEPAVVLNDLGMAYYHAGRPRDALDALTRAVSLQPDLGAGQNNLAGMKLETGDLAGAEAAFRAAILHQPDLPAAHANLATVLMRRGALREAMFHRVLAFKLSGQR